MANILERNNKVNKVKKSREEYAEDALYREVWEDVNNEKTQKFIKKYYKQILIVAVALVAITVGIQIGIRNHHANKLATAANYETALAAADAGALAAIGENAGGATADMALFQAYQIDHDVKKLEKLANDGHSRDLRDLARMHIVSIRGDEMTGDAVADYLSELDTKDSPYYYTSRLVVARKYLSENNRDAANKYLDTIINDPDAPAVISADAQTLR